MSDKDSFYLKIVEALRRRIYSGELKPGSRLPSIRQMSIEWNCAPGTVQRAYRRLTELGLVSSQVGQGSRVAEHREAYTPLRRATLVNHIEAFLLDFLAAGYTPKEIDDATHEVLDRWQARMDNPEEKSIEVIRFVGSHDPIVSLISRRFTEFAPETSLSVTFVGSLGGLMALARGGADIAGCHLWDAEASLYNVSFVRRLMPGRRVALLTIAHRSLGLIIPPGNPAQIGKLADIARPGIRFVNRQRGAGARVWLDARLAELGISPGQIEGYDHEVRLHLEVAGTVAGGDADAGLGLEAAALAYGLDFLPLTMERYDLVIPEENWKLPAIQAVARWLAGGDAKTTIIGVGGYDVAETGRVEWVE